jgi:preprotein translocase SecE subunit
MMANSAAAKAPQKAKGDGIFVRIYRFIRESYVETRFKSAWPTFAELRSFTLVVIFAVVVVAAWIGTLDAFFGTVTRSLGH